MFLTRLASLRYQIAPATPYSASFRVPFSNLLWKPDIVLHHGRFLFAARSPAWRPRPTGTFVATAKPRWVCCDQFCVHLTFDRFPMHWGRKRCGEFHLGVAVAVATNKRKLKKKTAILCNSRQKTLCAVSKMPVVRVNQLKVQRRKL